MTSKPQSKQTSSGKPIRSEMLDALLALATVEGNQSKVNEPKLTHPKVK